MMDYSPCPGEMGQDIKQIEDRKSSGRIKECRPNIIEKTLIEGRDTWIEEPVVLQWNVSSLGVSAALSELNELYEQWCASGPGPFWPSSDPLWLQTYEALRDAGLP